MGANERGQFSAAASSLGYFYQCRYALLEALQHLSDDISFSMGIETLDDIVIEKTDSSLEILQTKHHNEGSANLTNASIDLWKTLRIWIEGLSSGSIPPNTHFFLVTTSICSDGTAASYLRVNNRDVQNALEILNNTALTSTTDANTEAYCAFISMEEEDRFRLLESIKILDKSPSIELLDEAFRKVLFCAVKRDFFNSFFRRLEGWWYQRVINHLQDNEVNLIISEEIEEELYRLQEQFKNDNLPIDDEIMQEYIDASGFQNRTFVKQLKIVGVNEGRILHAINNYYRAYTQRSRWLREDLLLVGELDRYEQHLIEEWDLNFEQMRDEIGTEAAESVKNRAAKELYKWVESHPHRNIRAGVSHPFIARGTYQMLADDLRVGWHLEFRERLKSILSSEGVS